MNLQPFISLIKEKCGLFTGETHPAILENAIRTRMPAVKAANLHDYFEQLQHSPIELYALVDLFANNETYFFREPKHFTLVAERLAPALLAQQLPARGPLKILSAGCSAGAEPYSLAISLAEKFGPAILRNTSIKGLDVGHAIIAKAQAGVYNQMFFRGVNPELIARYFAPEGKDLKLNDFIREQVEFFSCSLLTPFFPEWMRDLDIIFYRNVSIYFQTGTRQQVFGKLAGLLRNGGFLIMSSAETYLHNFGILQLTEADGTFIFQKTESVTTGPAAAPPVPAQNGQPIAPAAPPAAAPTLAPEEAFSTALLLAQNKDYLAAQLRLEALLKEHPSHARAKLLQAAIQVNLQNPEAARKLCLSVLQTDEWNAQASLLLGLIAKQAGARGEAEKMFKTVLYLEPGNAMAHYLLGDLFKSHNETDGARREFNLAIKCLRQCGGGEGKFFFPLSVPPEELIRLCERYLSNMSGQKPPGDWK